MFCLLILFVLTIFKPTPTQAQIIISEVFPAPSDGPEWIELYNQSVDQTIDLTSWSIQDQLSSSSLIYTFDEEAILAPTNYLTIELAQPKLNNGADGITLFNNQQAVVDEMSYDSSQTALSWSRSLNGDFILSEPTKNLPNSTPTTSPSPILTPIPTPSLTPSPTPNPSPSPAPPSFDHSLIKIDSFVACPEKDEVESVTLLNTDSEAHQLIDWRLRDAANQTRKINLTLAAQSKGTVSWSNHFLNNDGDSLYLEDEAGHLIYSLSYDSCEKESKIDKNDEPKDDKSKKNEVLEKRNNDQKSIENKPVQTITLSPPPQPKSSYSLDQIQLQTSASSLAVQTNSVTTIQTASQPPLIALSSAILGGCLLLIRHGLPLLSDISQHFSGLA